MTWKAHIETLPRAYAEGRRLYLVNERRDGQYSLILPPTLWVLPPEGFIPEDKAFLDDSKTGGLFGNMDVRGFLQAMSDAAWEIGIKPKQIEDNRNELKAVRDHLQDMRSLALAKPTT